MISFSRFVEDIDLDLLLKTYVLRAFSSALSLSCARSCILSGVSCAIKNAASLTAFS